jgi:hypothetical protein
VVCDTECLKSPVPIRNIIRISSHNIHEVVATIHYSSVAYNSKDNHASTREIEMKIPDTINTNSSNTVTHENSVNDKCANNDYKLTHKANEGLKKSMEFKLPDKMQNDVAITELKTAQHIMGNEFMKPRPSVQDSLTSHYINRFPESMQVAQKKEYWDKKWMKQSDGHNKHKVKRNYIYNYNKYQQCYTSNINHWPTNRRQTPVCKTEKVNVWKQAFPSPTICNKNAVTECRMCGSDLAGSQKTANE